MLHFYTRLTLLLLPLFALFAITMSALGSTRPIHPALRGFVEGCEGIPQPCWYGIVPGVTTVGKSANILTGMGYLRGARYNERSPISFSQDADICEIDIQAQNDAPETTISSISLKFCVYVAVGDTFTVLGDATELGSNCFGSPILTSTYAEVRYDRLSVMGAARFVSLIEPDNFTSEWLNGYFITWRGFLSARSYEDIMWALERGVLNMCG